MKRFLLVAAAIGSLAFSSAAKANLLVGYLAECTAVTSTTCTESTATGYARQPIILNTPAFGKSVNSTPFSFAATVVGTFTGRALYDAPTSGNLLVVMPFATALTVAAPGDRGDVGAISLTVTALVAFFNGSFAQASVSSGGNVGPTQDGSIATAGSALTITRGELYKAGTITW